MNETTYLKNFRHQAFSVTKVMLLLYNQSKIPVLGTLDLTVTLNHYQIPVLLFVCHGTNILSLDLFHRLESTVSSPQFAAVCTLDSMFRSVLSAMKRFAHRPWVFIAPVSSPFNPFASQGVRPFTLSCGMCNHQTSRCVSMDVQHSCC